MSTATLAASADGRATQAAGRGVLLGDGAATWMLAFAAIVPFRGSPLGWALVAATLLSETVRRRRAVTDLWIAVPLLGLLSWMWLSLLWSVEPGHTASELFLNGMLVVVGLVVAVGRSLDDLVAVVVRSATWLLSACWVVTLLVPSVGRMTDTAYVGTMRGLFADKNLLGYYCVLALTATVAHLLGEHPRRGRGALDVDLVRRLAPVALAVATLLASGSRTALGVALFGALAAFVAARLARGRRPLALPVAAWLAVLAGLGLALATSWTTVIESLGRDPTLTGRTRIWQVVRYAIAQRPVEGYGWKALWLDGSPTTTTLWALNYRVPFYHAHNGYLDLTAQIGLVGVTLAVGLLLWLLVRSSVAFFARPTGPSGWPLVLVLVVLVYNLTEVVAFTNVTWALLVALSSILSRTRKLSSCTSRTRPV